MTELAALYTERDELVDLLRAVRGALANPRVRRNEVASAIGIALDGESSPAAVAEILRRFTAERGQTRPPAKVAAR
jgi:hypothetical protein